MASSSLFLFSKKTTYLTIDSSGAHGNNGYKTAEEDLLWSGNGYKKPFVAESRISALFGSINSQEHIPEPNFVNTLWHYTITAFLVDRKSPQTA